MQNHIRRDLISFAIPAFVTFSAGVSVCAWDFVQRYSGGVFEPSAVHVFGALLVIGAIVHNIGCQVTLGRMYSATLVTRQDHQLVTRGLYRYVRHPIYLGVIVAGTGIALFTTSILGLALMWCLIPVFLRRIRMEEGMLVDEFGAEYEAYMARTWKLFPFVY